MKFDLYLVIAAGAADWAAGAYMVVLCLGFTAIIIESFGSMLRAFEQQEQFSGFLHLLGILFFGSMILMMVKELTYK
jgi:hypothetical protein